MLRLAPTAHVVNIQLKVSPRVGASLRCLRSEAFDMSKDLNT